MRPRGSGPAALSENVGRWQSDTGCQCTVTSDTPTKITVKVPTGAATGYITVTTPSGSTTSATKFIYTGPTITGFTPSSGPPGTVVTITGSYLYGAPKVTFNGVAGTDHQRHGPEDHGEGAHGCLDRLHHSHHSQWECDQRHRLHRTGPTHHHRVHPVVGPTGHRGDHHRDQASLCSRRPDEGGLQRRSGHRHHQHGHDDHGKGAHGCRDRLHHSLHVQWSCDQRHRIHRSRTHHRRVHPVFGPTRHVCGHHRDQLPGAEVGHV